jgi:hypothetical protein
LIFLLRCFLSAGRGLGKESQLERCEGDFGVKRSDHARVVDELKDDSWTFARKELEKDMIKTEERSEVDGSEALCVGCSSDSKV